MEADTLTYLATTDPVTLRLALAAVVNTVAPAAPAEEKDRLFEDLYVHFRGPARPRVVCLCGSTRFFEAFQRANHEETLAGRIVLTACCDTHSDHNLGFFPEVKARLDELHLRTIDLADELLVLNVQGCIDGETRRAILYATSLNKAVRYLEPIDGE